MGILGFQVGIEVKESIKIYKLNHGLKGLSPLVGVPRPNGLLLQAWRFRVRSVAKVHCLE